MRERSRLSRSQLLGTPRFARLADQYIQDSDAIVDAADADVEVFDGMKMRPHAGLAIVLTEHQLMAFSGRGILGAKAPLTAGITAITEVGVTRQGNVSVEFRGDHGAPGFWKLMFGDTSAANR
jgi:hypothetical protein